MVIELYTGFPGAGKSFAATQDGLNVAEGKFNNNAWVIANFPVTSKKKIFHRFIKKEENKYVNTRWIYKDNDDLTVKYLVNKSKEMDWIGKEGSCLIIFDEASMPFNSRDWSKPDRKDWIKFLSQHRKFGYDFIFITQDAQMIDKQIRSLVEYEVVWRRLNSSFMFKWLSLFRVTMFAGIKYWNGMQRNRGNMRIYKYKKSVGDRYDTASLFDYEAEMDT